MVFLRLSAGGIRFWDGPVPTDAGIAQRHCHWGCHVPHWWDAIGGGALYTPGSGVSPQVSCRCLRLTQYCRPR